MARELAKLLRAEDAKLEALMQEEHAEHQEWSKRQAELLQEVLEQQAQAREQLDSMQRQAALQQGELNQLLEELQEILTEVVPAAVHLAVPNSESQKDTLTVPAIAPLPLDDDSKKLDRGLSTRRIWMPLVPKEKETRLGNFLNSPTVNAVCTMVILLNAIFIGFSSEYAVQHIGEPRNMVLQWFEWLFNMFYILELTLKLIAYKLHFFCNSDWKWNWFDFFLVLTGIYDLIMYFWESHAGNEEDSSGAGMMWMRLLRLLKMMKLLRVVRVMRFFRELRLMLFSIARSFRSLLWAMLMLLLIMYIFALCFIQGATVYITETRPIDMSQEVEESLLTHWTTVLDSLLTLFMAITGGDDWSNFLLSCTAFGEIYHYLFICYIMFQTIAVLNVLTGIFVEASLDAAQADQDNVIHEALELEAANADCLESVFFRSADGSEKSFITNEEFEQHFESDSLKAYFAALEIDIVHVRELFHELDENGDGQVSVEELRAGLMQLKGRAQSIDMISLAHDCRKYSRQLQVFMSFVEDYFGAISSEVEDPVAFSL
mmetsp:Transcript_79391/g.246513  ORF Transcript_79391/g.246513 Transcript_79391/m.246513 type:complete len:545 (+) Transcript_79391:1-1635(+)